MTHNDAEALLDEIHKNKDFRPTSWEKQFLEDLSFYVTIGNIKVSEKQGKILEKIYRKSQGGDDV